jgi:small-conductance mechanosensitive channel
LAVEDIQSPAFGDPRGSTDGLTYSVATYQAGISSQTPSLTAAIVRNLGARGLAMALRLSAVLLAIVALARQFVSKDILLWIYLPLLWVTALLSKGQLFTSSLISGASQDTLTYVLWAYDILSIAIIARLIYSFIVKVVIRDTAERPFPALVKYILQIIFFFAGAAYFYTETLGLNILPILATSSVLLTVVGFALRDIIFDAFSGIIITGDGSVRVNDWVQVRTRDRIIEGHVVGCGWRAVAIQSRDGVIHYVPNSACASQALTNLTAKGEYVRHETFFYMKTECVSPAFLDEVKDHLIKEIKGKEVSVDWTQPFRVMADRQEGYVTRCVIQFYFDPKQSLSSLRSLMLTTVRDRLSGCDAIPTSDSVLAAASV